jgi:hypothetical protein
MHSQLTPSFHHIWKDKPDEFSFLPTKLNMAGDNTDHADGSEFKFMTIDFRWNLLLDK